MSGLVKTSTYSTRSRALSPLIVSRGLLQPLDLSSRTDCAEHSLLCGCHLIFLIIIITTNICVLKFYDLSAWDGYWSLVSIWRFIHKFLDVCPYGCTAVAKSGKVGLLNLRLTTRVFVIRLRQSSSLFSFGIQFIYPPETRNVFFAKCRPCFLDIQLGCIRQSILKFDFKSIT